VIHNSGKLLNGRLKTTLPAVAEGMNAPAGIVGKYSVLDSFNLLVVDVARGTSLKAIRIAHRIAHLICSGK
jgi:hypothetical protein